MLTLMQEGGSARGWVIYLKGGLGDGVGLEGPLEVLGSGGPVLLGSLLFGQGLAIEGEGPLLGLEHLQAPLMVVLQLGCLLPPDIVKPAQSQNLTWLPLPEKEAGTILGGERL